MAVEIKLISLLKQVLFEGGNVFGITAPIKKEHIDPTLDKFIVELSKIFPKKAKSFKAFGKLGSAGKKDISGDIDLSYDAENIMPGSKPDLEGWGVDKGEFEDRFNTIRKKVRTATPEQSQLRAMLELIGTQIGEKSTLIEVDIKGASAGSIFCAAPQFDKAGKQLEDSVQIDINVGNPEWLKFSYHSNTYEGNVKGLHRTQLLVALFSNKGRMFKHEQGVLNRDTRELEAKTPKEGLKLLNKLYGTNISQDTLDDYFKLSAELKQGISSEELNRVYDVYLKILDSTRADIPTDLQQYWIDNQERLGLKGKFLPDESALIKYKK